MKCQICGAEIKKGSYRRKYCGEDCAREAHNRQCRNIRYTECAFCGKKFEQTGRKREFCSEECRKKFDSREAEKYCKVCGKRFIPTKELKNYCSAACRDAAKDRTLAEARRIIKYYDHTISDVVAQARAHGMSYGKYIQAKEMGLI